MATELAESTDTRSAGSLGRWLAGGALVAATAGLALVLARGAGSLLHVLFGYEE